MSDSRIQMVVIDDDPTGIQTVHGCLLITDWHDAYVREGFAHEQPFFYILTNTRAMTRDEAAAVTRAAMESVVRVNEEYGYHLVIVSRSDSCLRGHFPIETDVMQAVLVERGYHIRRPLPFCPAFIEAGRLTIDGIHYMSDGSRLTPIAETEFARDNVFGYHSSALRDYIEEKGANASDYEVINASGYEELNAFAAMLKAEVLRSEQRTAVVIRSSSSLPKALSGISDKPLLDRSILKTDSGVGCFVVGSHVAKTTSQLERLLSTPGTIGIEVDVRRILHDSEKQMAEIVSQLAKAAALGQTPTVYTSRKELRLDDADSRQHLGQRVSDYLVEIVRRLPFTPAYLVGKGGITSNDIMTHGLEVKTATVLGQVIPNVPCIMTEHYPYIIFPGNVGDEDSMRRLFGRLGG